MRLLSLARASFLIGALVAVTTPAHAQRRERDNDRWLDRCRNDWGDDSDERYCEVRDVPIRGTPSRLIVDGGDNGGVTVVGWDQNSVKVTARIQGYARSESDAKSIVEEIRILTDGTIRAEGPSRVRRSGWSVSYLIYTPKKMDLDLETLNGGIGIESVEGEMRLRATNGGLSLDAVSGDVRGETENGGIAVTLDGSRWRGTGLDVRTSNGGVELFIPSGYSAELTTGTVNGGFSVDFPIQVQGRLSHRLTTTLGSGGPPIRAVTTNGGVAIRRAR
jgi:DUF4097 and DUF4098 domain-containing protein YvlB